MFSDLLHKAADLAVYASIIVVTVGLGGIAVWMTTKARPGGDGF